MVAPVHDSYAHLHVQPLHSVVEWGTANRWTPVCHVRCVHWEAAHAQRVRSGEPLLWPDRTLRQGVLRRGPDAQPQLMTKYNNDDGVCRRPCG
jgi:hypothetical protein